MEDFTTSLRGEVVMTKATRRLLELDHPALPARSNVRALNYGEVWSHEGNRIELTSSGHLLGAAQVKVTLKDGRSIGYSSDFYWPLDQVMKVDALVVDATYGNPSECCKCTQEKAQEALADLVQKKLRYGPVHIMANTGPAERALSVLRMSDVTGKVPIIGNKRMCWYSGVYREFKHPMPDIISDESKDALHVMRKGQYIRLWTLHGRLPNDGLYEGIVIELTKYRTTKEPVEVVAEDLYRIGFSNHADFQGTLEYVAATGAKIVVTDNLRNNKNGRAEKLAKTLRVQLKVRSCVSSNTESLAWGK